MSTFTTIITPAPDSSVTLALNGDNTYASMLNGGLIAKGGYSITTDNAFDGQRFQLDNFVATGIFNVFTLIQVGSNGQQNESSNYFFMQLSHDTLYLSSPLTPGGSLGYTFVKQQ